MSVDFLGTVDMTYIGRVWEARDENGEAVAVRMYLGEDRAEDRRMVGLEDDANVEPY
jgi:hypothetical protein